MGWGRVTITYAPTGYAQNYKRDNVVYHNECQNMVADAVADSVVKIIANPPAGGIPHMGPIVNRENIAQNLAVDPGINYRLI
ncbi:hypothetical protein FK220_011545 [Flavobacteriaceae bacterium TP-CH-4]|uniref:Uncharacterized protein n=1 Tax=Pelagihabitans pacificus TaxID=2696054 RepID=A0A967ATZ9_9FLAO|nr:hypothetical protein [Pelagihabitans pacificus]NHF59979.1 hypothetical protein [Pelagihabitans pacificus]